MGLLDMCVGEKRTIIAPSKLAYEWGKGEHTSIKSVFLKNLLQVKDIIQCCIRQYVRSL